MSSFRRIKKAKCILIITNQQKLLQYNFFSCTNKICSKVYASILTCPKQYAWSLPRVTRKVRQTNIPKLQALNKSFFITSSGCSFGVCSFSKIFPGEHRSSMMSWSERKKKKSFSLSHYSWLHSSPTTPFQKQKSVQCGKWKSLTWKWTLQIYQIHDEKLKRLMTLHCIMNFKKLTTVLLEELS